jgi:putative nucleotidyltransferase with HDIG domain
MKSHKRFSPKTIFASPKIQRYLIFIVMFIILFVICSFSLIPTKYSLKAGDVAPADIKASRNFVDDVATNSKIEKAVSSIPLQYNRNTYVQKEAIDKIRDYFIKVNEIKNLNIDEKSKIEKLSQTSSLALSIDDHAAVLKLNDDEIKGISELLPSFLSKVLSQDIREDNEEDIKKAQDNLSFYIRNSSMTKSMKEIGTNIGFSVIKPNLYYDKERTEALREQAKKQVEPVVVKKNQNIISKGEVVSQQHIYLMKKAGLLKENPIADAQIFLGVAFIVLVVEVIIMISIYKFRRNIYDSNSKLLIIAIVLCINTIFVLGINIISNYIIPYSFLVMLMLLIFDPLIAFVVGIPSTLITFCITNFNIEVGIIYLVGCLFGIIFSYNSYQRNNLVFSGLIIGLLNGIVIFALGLLNNIDIIDNLISSLEGIAGGIISAILSIGVLPAFEQMFDITTPIKLLELSNPNQPLLKKMLFEAPGTYHHSILVGNLAEAAAEEVGANSLLARVGAYYHDVGKIKRPYFFKENQITNDNPHDKITPKLSTMIITSHVKDGIELANKYRIPNSIKKMIEEHHGTTLVRYFYAMALEDGNENIEESTFRYEGPKPSTKESAIVMLADSVEAAVRSLSSPAISDLEKMVYKIVDEKVADGQLNECELTLKELESIKASFVKVLIGIFHSRIEYPEINNETEGMEKQT